MTIVCGIAARPKEGATISGDSYVYASSDNGITLVAVIDGLGSGEPANLAARTAAEVLQAAPERPLEALLRQAHNALNHTRGAVIGALRLEHNTRTARYVGVGNIGVHVYGNPTIRPISKNGILGYRLPTLLELSYQYNFGDTFVLYSDGVASRFFAQPDPQQPAAPQALADYILEHYGKRNDDATVLVLREDAPGH